MSLYEYFDRISIIHLPEQKERFRSISHELLALGCDIGSSKARIMFASRPTETNGFPSRGVYGGFLSHLQVLRSAMNDGLHTVLVLEDDAIFSRCMLRSQADIVKYLQLNDWDLCYFGHSLSRGMATQGFVRLTSTTKFVWAHCYAVHARVLARVVRYLESCLVMPAGHPDGGKLYIDAAFNIGSS